MPVKRSALIVTAAAAVLVAGLAPTMAGNVAGTIKFEGTAPRMRPVKMDSDPGCAAKHGSDAPLSEQVVVGEGNGLANVIVSLDNPPAGNYSAPSEPVVLDQQGCRYDPHVMGIMVGQEFKILNSDGLLHNVHSLSKDNKSFNMAMPASRKEAVREFSKPERFSIKCDVHPWMKAWVQVFEHPFFAVSDANGNFEIENVPAGTYEVTAWHESKRLGEKTASVTVAADGTATLDFSFAPEPGSR
jgi:plastocyanin